jgi:hypothetical protein
MPKKEKVLTVHLRLMITPELDEELELASKLDHRKKPDFVRHYLNLVSKEVIMKYSQFTVIKDVSEVLKEDLKKNLK